MNVLGVLDRGSIARNAAIAGGIALVGGVIGSLVPSITSVLAVVILAGMAMGGFGAGRDQPRVALSAGGITTLIASTVLMVLSLIVAAARNRLDLSDFVSAVFIVLVCTSLGVLGGYLAFHRARLAGQVEDVPLDLDDFAGETETETETEPKPKSEVDVEAEPKAEAEADESGDPS
jgi:hypothetical protein